MCVHWAGPSGDEARSSRPALVRMREVFGAMVTGERAAWARKAGGVYWKWDPPRDHDDVCQLVSSTFR